jgi:hypothetical protein
MAFSIRERPSSRDSTSSPPTVNLRYVAQGEHNEAIVKATALAAIPAIVATAEGILYRQDLQVEPAGYDVYYITAPFAQRKKENGTWRLTFDTTGGTLNIKAARQHVASYPDGPGTPNHGGAIGVKSNKEVEGVDIVVPALKLTVHFKHPAGIVTLPRIKNLARWTGNVNSDTFLTFAPGEVLFLGATGSEGSDAETEVAHHFACSENLQDKVIGGITVAQKQGHDVYWIEFKNDVSATPPRPVSPPEFIHVERVYDRIPMAASLGFGG